MKKNALNGNTIGSDNTTTTAGIIPFSKIYLHRINSTMTPVGSGVFAALVQDGLVFYVDFLDGASYPGSGLYLSNLGSAGASLDWELAGSPVFVQGSTNADTYMNFDSTDDYGYVKSINDLGSILTTNMTVGWIVQSTDLDRGMVASKSTGGAGYLAAFQTNGNFYNSEVGSATSYIDKVGNSDSEGLDGSFHMLEFKDVDFTGWTTGQGINMPARYSGFVFQGHIKAMFMYDRSITAAESSTNYDAFQANKYL